MRLNKFFTALAFIGAAFTTTHATLTYNNGDLLLGFRATGDPGSTKDYIVDLGPASQFTPTTGLLALGNIGADLSSASLFGSSWATRPDLVWGLIGTDLPSDPANTIYASRAETGAPPTLTPTTPWARRVNSQQSTTNSTIRAFDTGFASSPPNALNPAGTVQTLPYTNSYAQNTASGTDFGAYNTIEGNFANGTDGAVLDVFRLTPTNQAAGDVTLGSVKINSNGDLFYNGVAQVPEPESYMLGGIAAALALGLPRHRNRLRLA